MKFVIRNFLYIILGFLFLSLGAIGAVLPILPTTPFLLLASFFFARGSGKFNNWFLSTKLYKNHLESFVNSRSMTLKTKLRILTLSTTMLIIAIYLTKNIYIRMAIILIMIYKYYYFKFNIKTINKDSDSPQLIDKKINKEKKVVQKMIEIYCRGNKHEKSIPCSECRELIDYAHKRINKCPFIRTKTFCSSCSVNCYEKDMREKIRTVMRYSGPRMIFYNPIMAISHAVEMIGNLSFGKK